MGFFDMFRRKPPELAATPHPVNINVPAYSPPAILRSIGRAVRLSAALQDEPIGTRAVEMRTELKKRIAEIEMATGETLKEPITPADLLKLEVRMRREGGQ